MLEAFWHVSQMCENSAVRCDRAGSHMVVGRSSNINLCAIDPWVKIAVI